MRRALILALGVAVWAAPTAAQTPSDMAPIHCLSAPEASVMMDALDKRTKADSCTEDAGADAARRCHATESAADAAEKRVEEFSARMERLEQSVLTVRAHYRRC